jgi:hypothetical protein
LAAVVAIQTVAIACFLVLLQQAAAKAVLQHKATRAVQAVVLVTVVVHSILVVWVLLGRATMAGRAAHLVHQAAVVAKALLDQRAAQAAVETAALV